MKKPKQEFQLEPELTGEQKDRALLKRFITSDEQNDEMGHDFCIIDCSLQYRGYSIAHQAGRGISGIRISPRGKISGPIIVALNDFMSAIKQENQTIDCEIRIEKLKSYNWILFLNRNTKETASQRDISSWIPLSWYLSTTNQLAYDISLQQCLSSGVKFLEPNPLI